MKFWLIMSGLSGGELDLYLARVTHSAQDFATLL